MNAPALTTSELTMMRAVFRQHPEVVSAILFGSRAKGTHTEYSDVDLALTGTVAPLRAEAIAAELDELPLPYRFEVQALAHIHYPPLVEHIQQVGIPIYPETVEGGSSGLKPEP